jgi:hypothetical protein
MSHDKLAFIRADMAALRESNLLFTFRVEAAAEWEAAKARSAQALLGGVEV